MSSAIKLGATTGFFCVLPKMQHAVVLDSAAGYFVKPTHQRAVSKMWSALLVASNQLSLGDWSFHVNSPNDVQQQEKVMIVAYLFACLREPLLFPVLLSLTRT